MVEAHPNPSNGDTKECMNVVLLGHCYSGKTMLAGNLKNQLGYH